MALALHRDATAVAGVSLEYDPAGRLIKTTSATSVITRFVYDGADLIGEYDSAGTTLLRRYVHGPSTDEPLVWHDGAGSA